MREVRFKKLALSGFGPYRDRVEVELSDGINTFIARNERGKSSLVMGLIAVIFGLPGKTNPSDFGHARFRNWDGPQRFEGELLFEADGALYRLRRNFDTHEISLSRLEDGKHVNLVTGEDNPLALKRNAPYEKWLKEVFGMTSRKLFECTFCVTQPLPETRVSDKSDKPEGRQLDKRVQELLSGTGASFAQVLKSLVDQLKEETRATGDRGVTPRNQQDPRRLEELTSRISEMRSQIESGRDTVDSLEAMRKRQRDIESELETTRAELASKEAIRNAWSEWRRLSAEYRQAVREQSRAEEVLEQARKLASEIEAESMELKELYPELEDAPEDIEERLASLISLREKLGEISSALSETQSLLRGARARCEDLRAELAGLRNWGELGSSPEAEVRNIRRRAGDLVQSWRDLQANLSSVAECDSILMGELRIINEASTDEIHALESYSATLARLERNKVEAERRWAAIDEQVKAFERSWQEFQKRYSGIASLLPDASETLARKLDLLRKERALRESLAERRRKLEIPSQMRAAVGLAAAVLGGALAWSAWGRSTGIFGSWTSVGTAVLLGVLGYFLSGPVYSRMYSKARLDAENAERYLAACQSELAALDTVLGDMASNDEATLGALHARARQRDEDARALHEEEAALPGEEERAKAREALERALQEYDAFVELTNKFSRRFIDVDLAYSEWKAASARRRNALELAREFAHSAFGCEPGVARNADPYSPNVSDIWREAARFLRVAAPGQDVSTVTQLVAFLESCDAAWWEGTTREAARYEEICEDLRNLETAMATRQEQLQSHEGRRLGLEESYRQLSASLDAVLRASGADPEQARRRWAERRSRAERINKKHASLDTLFRQQSVNSVGELREKRVSADNNAAQALSAWKRLIDSNPGLPETHEAEDTQKLDARWRSLEEDVRRLRERVTTLEDERYEARKELSRLEGQSPINIAQAELELARLEREREDAELLADALTEACKELNAAIADFQASHRNRLEEAATEHFRKITGVHGRSVVIDDEFRVSLDDNGVPCDLAQLSKGAQDQLYIALRLAIADLLAADVGLPLIFDDPFASCDSNRLANLGQTLQNIASRRQVIVLSHIKDLSAWGLPIELKGM